MKVGDLVKYIEDVDAGANWMGVVTTVSDCGRMAWIYWAKMDQVVRNPVKLLEKIQ